MNCIFKYAKMLGVTVCLITLLLSSLCSAQDSGLFDDCSDEGKFGRVELGLAILRGPIIMASEHASKTHSRNARLLKLCANLIRISNDFLAAYNASKMGDVGCFNYSPAMMWGINDICVALSDLIGHKTDKELGDETFGADKDSEQLSKKEKILVEYVLPFAEWMASLYRAGKSIHASTGISNDFPWQSELEEWSSNIVISGSRILSELIKNKSGSLEQKLAIGKAVFCASMILFDIYKGNFIHGV